MERVPEGKVGAVRETGSVTTCGMMTPRIKHPQTHCCPQLPKEATQGRRPRLHAREAGWKDSPGEHTCAREHVGRHRGEAMSAAGPWHGGEGYRLWVVPPGPHARLTVTEHQTNPQSGGHRTPEGGSPPVLRPAKQGSPRNHHSPEGPGRCGG